MVEVFFLPCLSPLLNGFIESKQWKNKLSPIIEIFSYGEFFRVINFIKRFYFIFMIFYIHYLPEKQGSALTITLIGNTKVA